MKKDIFRSLEESARIGALSETQRAAYEHSLKVYRDNYAIAKTERMLGHAEGRKEGIAEGIAKGKQDMVRNMLDAGIDLSTVSKVSGISVDELRRINI